MNIDLSDGGPAFPSQGLFQFHTGMSLRAWLAGQVLPGLLASCQGVPYHTVHAARLAAEYADALLAELNRPRAGEAPPPSTPLDP